MTPPQIHISCETLSSEGKLPSSTVGAPATQGAGVAGMQGIGVSTPRAAAVAAATVGLAIDVHIPKGMILTIGIWSMMFASGTILVITLLVGNTTSELGATPKLHCIIAPIQTCRGMIRLLHRWALKCPLESTPEIRSAEGNLTGEERWQYHQSM